MLKIKLIIVLLLFTINVQSQTNLLQNGDFEATQPWTNWIAATANGNLWAGGSTACSVRSGQKYAWLASQTQTAGVNDAAEEVYQTVTIPANATSVNLYFLASVNTTETGTTAYDFMRVRVKSTSGTLLHDWGYISNAQGDYGIPGCQTWKSYNTQTSLPSSLFGQTVRFCLEFETDFSDPTIFRMDSVCLIATTSTPCTYSLTQNSYFCPNANATTYSNIISVLTQNGCSWSASVTSGNSWLSTSSTGIGSGNITINVTQNTSSAARVGEILINGEILQITQPGTCSYNLGVNSFTCPNTAAATYSNICTVSTQNGCIWNANVTLGSAWISTTSNGNGNGNVSINVTENTSNASRSGTIVIGGQTLTINQPGTCNFGLSTYQYNCPNAAATSYADICNITAQTGCNWTANVTSGSSWISTTSSGTGNGTLSITVAENTSSNLRTGTILIQGLTITINQPGTCNYNLTQTTFNCPSALANNYNNIANVETTAGCSWNAAVTNGNTWISTLSSGTGNGSVSISVLANTSSNARVGTVLVQGKTITINQPGVCEYNLSVSTFNCTSALANNYADIASVNTNANCNWAASVTTGNTWLSTISGGTGTGNISITVLSNPDNTARTGIITVQGQTLTVNQPAATVGMAGINQLQFVNIYPNPSNGIFTVDFNQILGVKNVAITNILGENIANYQANGNLLTVNLDKQPKGIYFINITNINTNKVFKVLVE